MAEANNKRPDFRRQETLPPRSRDYRNANRLRKFLEKKNPNPTGDWAEEFDSSHIVAQRAPPRRKKKTPKPQSAKNEPDLDSFRAKTETPLKDEPLYDIGTCTAGYLLTEKQCVNFEFSGFITLVKQTYEAMRTIDARVDRQMPYAAFLHHCTVYLNAVFLDRTREQGGWPTPATLLCQDAIVQEGSVYLVPEVIQEYVRNVGKFTTTNGQEVFVNVPEIAVPGPPTEVALTATTNEHVESGFFGPCDLATHNVYECYIAPAVTARYLEANRTQTENWRPLPEAYTPDNGVPNFNLLGYDLIQRLDQPGISRLEGLFIPDDDTVEGRLKYSPELCARVNTYLSSIKDKFSVSNIPKQTKARTGLSNALFVETPGNVKSGPGQLPLSSCAVRVFSNMAFGHQIANHAYLDVTHRRRRKAAAGFCFTTDTGAMLARWDTTMNANFDMSGRFSPRIFENASFLRAAVFACEPGGGRRISALDAWIKKLQF